ncbi:hypothetical protein BG011_010022 [Mortierella polycephala]|uniref:Mitochondrial carrier n=1 Tax=Mortierella polycephala TaxID=41804 RepID=A0A9P6TVS3_9FUNG|nr:hypothetical protein BG011_010022 [Mortierella polycephala]
MTEHALNQQSVLVQSSAASVSAISSAISAATLPSKPNATSVTPGSGPSNKDTAVNGAGSSRPSPAQRMMSACAGSLLTSLLVTPLDVVKTRLQSQTVVATPTCAVPFTYTNNASAYEKLCTCCREVFYAPQQNAAIAGIRQNIAKVLAGGSSALNSSSAAAASSASTSSLRQNKSRIASTGCGSSIAQQHQEGTVVGMKASKIQQQRLEQLATHCAKNNHATKAAQERYFHGTWDGIKKIIRYEGATSLWRGLTPTVAMSIPATVIYFVGYDYLKDVLSEQMSAASPGLVLGRMSFIYDHRESLAPLAAGGFARAVAATVISPIELFRTRMQSVHTDTKGNSGLFRGVSQGIVAMVRSEGALSLWRGLAPTLWRDVPFSAIYWMGYENIKKRLVAWNSQRANPVVNEFGIAFSSGALSGMTAAILTTPFDVAKTRRQVDLMQPHHAQMASLMKAIVKEEGFKGLWRGLTARVAKVAPSCAIMISSYEIGKKALSEHWWGIGTSSSSSGTSGGSSGSTTTVGDFAGSPEGQYVFMRDRQIVMAPLRSAGVAVASTAV